jgi:hypothetical protein
VAAKLSVTWDLYCQVHWLARASILLAGGRAGSGPAAGRRAAGRAWQAAPERAPYGGVACGQSYSLPCMISAESGPSAGNPASTGTLAGGQPKVGTAAAGVLRTSARARSTRSQKSHPPETHRGNRAKSQSSPALNWPTASRQRFSRSGWHSGEVSDNAADR